MPVKAAASVTEIDSGIVEVEGAHLRYRVEGHGPPCLVVGDTNFYPRVFSPGLRKHLRLVFLDLRHFAATDPSFEPDRITIETLPADIEQARQTLDLGDVVVIGHSTHGTMALEYARRYPEHVRGVAAIGAPPRRGEEPPSASERLWEADASKERKEILARQLAYLKPGILSGLSPSEIWVREYVANGPRYWYGPTHDASHLFEGVVLDVPVMQRLFGEVFGSYDLAQGPAEITVPVLIAHGRYDYAVAYTGWEEHRLKLPRHRYVRFESSGHFPPLEEPERFDQTLLAWIDELGNWCG
jgi:proline iminopeptidase